MTAKLTLEILGEATKGASAIRCVSRLQPAGGRGDKVFPPTYLGGVYAVETRLIADGSAGSPGSASRRVKCVLLDSVQSQANRMEAALLQAWRDGRIKIPVITVDFSGRGLQEVGRNFRITSLDAPHRIADAILRDSVVKVNGRDVPFAESDYARRWGSARAHNATELFRLCPTALLFGTWGSPEKPGGLGPRFPRAVVSEIVAVDVEFGVRTSSRIDPLGIQSNAAKIYSTGDGGWTLNAEEAVKDKQKPALFGSGKSAGKPSAINHGNIPPDISKWQTIGGAEIPLGGGVTMDHALQTTVVSLSALRRLEFPISDDGATAECDIAARTALAALGICAATLARTDGDIRSRCQLVPVETPRWEIVGGASETAPAYELTPTDAVGLLSSAVEAVNAAGIPWQEDEIRLEPSPKLVELVRRSQESVGEGNADEGPED